MGALGWARVINNDGSSLWLKYGEKLVDAVIIEYRDGVSLKVYNPSHMSDDTLGSINTVILEKFFSPKTENMIKECKELVDLCIDEFESSQVIES